MEGFELKGTEPLDLSLNPPLTFTQLISVEFKEVNEELVTFFSLHSYPPSASGASKQKARGYLQFNIQSQWEAKRSEAKVLEREPVIFDGFGVFQGSA